jgi:hypothetical protein
MGSFCRSSIVSRRACCAVALCGVLLLVRPTALSSQTANTDDVKAAFLFNFAKFVEWPSEATSGGAPLNLGVLGNDAVNDALRTMTRDKTVAGRAVTVRRATASEDLAAFNMLFVGQSEKARVGDVLKRLDGTTVLTVSDADRFCEQGGIIGLVVEDNHVRFDVSLDAAERSRLKVSSKLLNLARRVLGSKQGDR